MHFEFYAEASSDQTREKNIFKNNLFCIKTICIKTRMTKFVIVHEAQTNEPAFNFKQFIKHILYECEQKFDVCWSRFLEI